MKKIFITVLLAGTAIGAGAQSMYDALNFSENRYYGTARTLAMGNAFTALGGDPGSIGINPAGSAVARYSQVTITPGLSVAVNTSQGTYSGEYGFGTAMLNTTSRFSLPNVGVTLNFDTHRERGVKNVSIGFVKNSTNLYNNGIFAKGLNQHSSYSGWLASASTGIAPSLFESSKAYENGDLGWNLILGYLGGATAHLDALGDDHIYAGATDNVFYEYDDQGKLVNTRISMGGPINQSYGISTKGYRDDYLINLGMNISDYVFVGVNLGITSLNYKSEHTLSEASEENDLFQTGFNSLKYNSSYRASGTGVYGKFGVIVTPVGGLRIGAAIQTPTSTVIKETWGANLSTKFKDSSYNSSANTPEGEYSYRLLSPFRFNLGVAYTFGSRAILSADYEFCDYSRMFFKERNTFDNSTFSDVNSDIRGYMGAGHLFRLGAEFKPADQFSVRAGYELMSSPEKFESETGMKYSKACEHAVALGFGYSSKGSFYIDAAVQARMEPDKYVMPYENYLSDAFSPEILCKKVLFNAAVTFGFRF